MLIKKFKIKREKKAYDKRIVNYEIIHQVKDKDYDKLNELCQLNDGDSILDYGAGYGSVTNELIKRNNEKELNFTLLEPSEVQIHRAEILIKPMSSKINIKYMNSTLSEAVFSKKSFSHIVSKVALHEMPVDEQELELKSMFNLLKQRGSIYIWTINCDIELQNFVQSFFRRKDSLTNLFSLAKNRYFANKDELMRMIKGSGFNEHNISAYDITPMTYETKNQLDQDFKGNFLKLKLFNQYIRKSVRRESDRNRALLRFSDEGNAVTVHFPQFIIKATKI